MSGAARSVTVVIPTRNRAELLRRALGSALGQEGVAVEIVVVDEASQDGTAEFLRAIRDDRVGVVRHEAPRGVAAARNAGLARATAPWTAFLDDDDVWAPDKLAAQLDALDATPEAEWSCAGAVVVADGIGVLEVHRTPPPEDLATTLLTMNVVPGGGSGVVARTDALRELGGFDEGLSMVADWDLWLRLALRSTVACVDRPLVLFRQHARSMSSATPNTEAEIAHMERKHAGERARRGVALDPVWWSLWRAQQLSWSGRRRPAVAGYLEAARHARRTRMTIAAGVSAIWPGWRFGRERYRLRRRGPRAVPAHWAREVDALLGATASRSSTATPSAFRAR